jgi:hypothetical protein
MVISDKQGFLYSFCLCLHYCELDFHKVGAEASETEYSQWGTSEFITHIFSNKYGYIKMKRRSWEW